MKKRFRKLLSLTLTFAVMATMLVGMSFGATAATGGNPAASVIELPYKPGDTARSSYNFQWGYASENPKTVTRLNADGTLSVCVEPAESSPEYPYVYIYELDKNLAVAKTLKIKKANAALWFVY